MRIQRAYIAEHPVVFWFSLGIAVAGAASLLAPGLTDQSSASQLLPAWLRIAFDLVYAIGGTLSFVGILWGFRKLEAAGMALLASGLLTNFLMFAWLVKGGLISAAFLFFLALGCAERSWHLATAEPVRLEPDDLRRP